MKKSSGDPRKKQATKGAIQAELARRKSLLMSKQKEWKAETLRLFELFEKQYPESAGLLYDEVPYIGALGAIAIHRADCELTNEPEKYNPSQQMDTLELVPAMRDEIEEFLLRNKLDKPETYQIFGSTSSGS